MNRRERLMATLRGDAVDRPAVSFYEIGGLMMNPADVDPFNVYSDPSWQPLLKLAEQSTDLIRLRSAVRTQSHEAWDHSDDSKGFSCRNRMTRVSTFEESGCRMTRVEVRIGGRTLTTVTRREPDVDTLWTVEHPIKNDADLAAYLSLPDDFFHERIDVQPLIDEEQRLGDRGIVMVDTEDPLCAAATLFNMQDYTVAAFTEPRRFHQLLEKVSRAIYRRTEQVAREFPGRLWRIYGPEYACEPYLPPTLFKEFVVRYVKPMVQMIQRYGGFARIHCHGRIRNNLSQIVAMGVDAIDPIEPNPQGDVQLEQVRREYGDQLVLFGNLEVVDLCCVKIQYWDQVSTE
jgi:hypothetical protein